MIRHPWIRLPSILPPQIAPGILENDLTLTFRWWLETVLARVRWCAVPISFVAIPLFPTVPWILLALAAFGFGLGNLLVIRLLHQTPSNKQLSRSRSVATVVDWVSVMGSLSAFSGESVSATPAVFVLLIMTGVLRYGMPGLVMSAAGSLAVLVILIVAQVQMLAVLDVRQATVILASWVVVLAVVALVLAFLTQSAKEWQLWHRVKHELIRDARVDSLSKRQMELLPLLARKEPELTYEQIGALLCVSPETVKTHVRRMGEKLGVRGRWAVVALADERGMIPYDSSANS